jgi:beta-lactamase class A
MNSKVDLEKELIKSKQVLKKQLAVFGFILLAVVVVFSVYIYRNLSEDCVSCREEYRKELFRYSFLDPTRNLMEQKDAITNIDPLRKKLKELVALEASSSRISIYFEVLNTGANISVNQDEKIFPVSLAKVPLAMLVIKKIENGEFDINQQFEITDENMNSSSGYLFETVKSGSKVEMQKLLREMLINSDNTAYRILKRNTNLEDRKKLADDIGLGELFDDQGRISAKEYSRLLRTLYTASYLNQEHSQMILELLSQNSFKNYLSTGMPGDTVFSHKHGQNLTLNVYSDSGIVYLPNRPYIISAMVEPFNLKGHDGEIYAENLFRQFSQEAYQFIKNK